MKTENVAGLPGRGDKQVNRRLPWLTILPLAFFVFIAGGASGNPKDPLTIQSIPATVAKRTYDPDHPDPRMPTTHPDEAGVTVSEYGCVAEVSGQMTRTSQTHSDATVAVRVDSIHIVLKLNVTEWMSQVAPQKIWYHEDGHRMIALHFYDHADEVAAAIARGWMGQSLWASGPDAKSAAKEAITQIARRITAAYMAQVRDQSELVQEAYDRITAHGTNNVDEADAIKQALAEVAQSATKPSPN
ncbi:MAG: hypothetical protein ABSB74_14000 [Tepidisphaeraceae bacterium]